MASLISSHGRRSIRTKKLSYISSPWKAPRPTPFSCYFSPGNGAVSTETKKKKTCANGAQFLPGLQFKYAHKSILIYLCFLLRPAGWPAVSGPERGRQTTSKNCYRKSSTNVWILVPCQLQIWLIFPTDFLRFSVIPCCSPQTAAARYIHSRFLKVLGLFLSISRSFLLSPLCLPHSNF